MKKDEELNEFDLPLTVRYVPDNILGMRRIAKLVKPRNLIEGLILALLICIAIWFIPFKSQVKLLFMLVFGISSFMFGCWGISNRSITEFIYTKIRHNANAMHYKKRSIEHVRRTSGTTSKDGESLSIAEAIYYNISESYRSKKEVGEKFTITDIIDALKTLKA